MAQKTEKQRRSATNRKPPFDKKMKPEPDKPSKLRTDLQEELDKKLLNAAWNAKFQWQGSKNAEEILRLIKAGADVNAKSECGKTALMGSAGAGNKRICAFLLENGADMETTDVNGITPLMESAYRGRASTCALLIKKGASVNATDKSGRTPLMWAAYLGRIGVCSLLIENGASINASDTVWGRTALIWAAMRGFSETCAFLVSKGADAKAIDKAGMDALGYARQINSPDMINLFASQAASIDMKDGKPIWLQE
jgi:ankyrin repeat protein